MCKIQRLRRVCRTREQSSAGSTNTPRMVHMIASYQGTYLEEIVDNPKPTTTTNLIQHKQCVIHCSHDFANTMIWHDCCRKQIEWLTSAAPIGRPTSEAGQRWRCGGRSTTGQRWHCIGHIPTYHKRSTLDIRC